MHRLILHLCFGLSWNLELCFIISHLWIWLIMCKCISFSMFHDHFYLSSIPEGCSLPRSGSSARLHVPRCGSHPENCAGFSSENCWGSTNPWPGTLQSGGPPTHGAEHNPNSTHRRTSLTHWNRTFCIFEPRSQACLWQHQHNREQRPGRVHLTRQLLWNWPWWSHHEYKCEQSWSRIFSTAAPEEEHSPTHGTSSFLCTWPAQSWRWSSKKFLWFLPVYLVFASLSVVKHSLVMSFTLVVSWHWYYCCSIELNMI